MFSLIQEGVDFEFRSKFLLSNLNAHINIMFKKKTEIDFKKACVNMAIILNWQVNFVGINIFMSLFTKSSKSQ